MFLLYIRIRIFFIRPLQKNSLKTYKAHEFVFERNFPKEDFETAEITTKNAHLFLSRCQFVYSLIILLFSFIYGFILKIKEKKNKNKYKERKKEEIN